MLIYNNVARYDLVVAVESLDPMPTLYEIEVLNRRYPVLEPYTEYLRRLFGRVRNQLYIFPRFSVRVIKLKRKRLR